MSYLGVDPGDLTPDEMYDRGRDERDMLGDEAGALPAFTCDHPDCTRAANSDCCFACAAEDSDAAMAAYLLRVRAA